MSTSFLRFLLAGSANTIVGYSMILLLGYGFGLAPKVANAGGYAIGLLLAYVLHHRFTFASDKPHMVAAPRFIVTAICCYFINLATLDACLKLPAIPVAIAQAVAVGAYTLTFYLISRFLVFRA